MFVGFIGFMGFKGLLGFKGFKGLLEPSLPHSFNGSYLLIKGSCDLGK